jgi:hypothetical protein
MANNELGKKEYSKVLVAKYRPANKCFATDGDVLFVIPRVPRSRRMVEHTFTSVSDWSANSRYGWVEKRDKSFTVEEFIATHLKDRPVSAQLVAHLAIMFDAIEMLQVNSVVGVAYSPRGVMEKRMELWVHPVLDRSAR